MKKYLVTGGTGFIGSALVRSLYKSGSFIRVLDNDLRGAASRLNDISGKIEIINSDIRDPRVVQEACQGMDSVCHLAYLNGTEFFYTQPELVLEIGVKGIINVIDGCLKEGVEELIVASSSEVYQTPRVIPANENIPLCVPDPHNPRYSYGAGKIISELMAINYGRRHFKRVIIFRPHNVYGPDMGGEHVIPQFIVRMKEMCKDNKERRMQFPIQGDGTQTRSFIFIKDFIEGLMTVIEKGMHLEIYNIGTMEEVSIAEVAHMVGNYFAKDVVIVPGKPAQGGVLRRCPDISKLRSLGFTPRISLKEGIEITAEWYDKNSQKIPKKIFVAEENYE